MQISFEEVRQKLNDSVLSNLKIITKEKLSSLLEEWGNKKEEMALHNLDFIRKRNENGCIYFIYNLHCGKDIDDFIKIATKSNRYNINFASIRYSEFDASGWDLVESGLTGDASIVIYELWPE